MSEARHAVVLSGGGAYAAYEIGVLKALFQGRSPATGKQPLEPAIYTGTSAGAFNAALLVSHSDRPATEALARLESIWRDEIAGRPNKHNGVYRARMDPALWLNPLHILRNPREELAHLFEDSVFLSRDALRRTANLFTSKAPLMRRVIDLVDVGSLFNTEPFAELIERILRPRIIQDSPRALRIAVTNWSTGELRVFKNKEMTDAHAHRVVQASAAIPGFFPPVNINGDTYVDGGVVMNTPLEPAIKAQADVVHVVYLDPDVRKIPIDRIQSTVSALDRLLVVSMANAVNRDIETANLINQGLKHMDKTEAMSAKEMTVHATLEARQQEKPEKVYRKLFIHRYHPSEDLGDVTGILNMELSNIESLIEKGYRDTVEHNCTQSQCVWPDLPEFSP